MNGPLAMKTFTCCRIAARENVNKPSGNLLMFWCYALVLPLVSYCNRAQEFIPGSNQQIG
jgi:hypothetical protein